MLNLPNAITLARIMGIGAFLFVLNSNFKYGTLLSAAVFAILALTDALDGFIARRANQVTTLGKFIDPLADKLLVAAALIFLIGQGIPKWMAFAIIAREFAITGMRIIAASKDVVIDASMMGKIKTVSLIIGIMAVLIQFQYAWHLMLLATVLTIVSGIDYLWKARHLLS